MGRKIWLLVLLIVLLLPQTQTPAVAMLTPQDKSVQRNEDKSVPRNGCVIYNPYNQAITLVLRNKKSGVWDQRDVIGSGGNGIYIEKDYIWLQNGSAAKRVDYKKKYEIIWNGYLREWDIRPI